MNVVVDKPSDSKKQDVSKKGNKGSKPWILVELSQFVHKEQLPDSATMKNCTSGIIKSISFNITK